ncbi:MAG TPA: hypothetical protein VGF25_20950 [Thermoleophilaceae bacterium]|jgi:hypothetical protein
MKTPRERADERRQAKLDEIRDQIAAGTLTVRKMTAEEHAANPPRPRPATGRGRRRF